MTSLVKSRFGHILQKQGMQDQEIENQPKEKENIVKGHEQTIKPKSYIDRYKEYIIESYNGSRNRRGSHFIQRNQDEKSQKQSNQTLFEEVFIQANSFVSNNRGRSQSFKAVNEKESCQIKYILDLTKDEDKKILKDTMRLKEKTSEFQIDMLKRTFAPLKLFVDLEKQMKKQDYNQMFRHLRYLNLPKGSVVFEYGDIGEKYYIILRGSVYVLLKTNYGETVRKMKPTQQSDEKTCKKVSKTEPSESRRQKIIKTNTIVSESKKSDNLQKNDKFQALNRFDKQVDTNRDDKIFELKRLEDVVYTKQSKATTEDYEVNSEPDCESKGLVQKQEIKMRYPQFSIVANHLEGESFGEYSLIKNIRRTATIITAQETIFLTMDKSEYNEILKDHIEAIFQRKIQFLKTFKIFESLEKKIHNLVMCFQSIYYSRGDIIYNEQDDSHSLYFIQDGEVEISQRQQSQPNDQIKISFEREDEIDQYDNNNSINKLMLNTSYKLKKKIIQNRQTLAILNNKSYFGEDEIILKSKKRITQAKVLSASFVGLKISLKNFLLLSRFTDVMRRLRSNYFVKKQWRETYHINCMQVQSKFNIATKISSQLSPHKKSNDDSYHWSPPQTNSNQYSFQSDSIENWNKKSNLNIHNEIQMNRIPSFSIDNSQSPQSRIYREEKTLENSQQRDKWIIENEKKKKKTQLNLVSGNQSQENQLNQFQKFQQKIQQNQQVQQLSNILIQFQDSEINNRFNQTQCYALKQTSKQSSPPNSFLTNHNNQFGISQHFSPIQNLSKQSEQKTKYFESSTNHLLSQIPISPSSFMGKMFGNTSNQSHLTNSPKQTVTSPLTVATSIDFNQKHFKLHLAQYGNSRECTPQNNVNEQNKNLRVGQFIQDIILNPSHRIKSLPAKETYQLNSESSIYNNSFSSSPNKANQLSLQQKQSKKNNTILNHIYQTEDDEACVRQYNSQNKKNNNSKQDELYPQIVNQGFNYYKKVQQNEEGCLVKKGIKTVDYISNKSTLNEFALMEEYNEKFNQKRKSDEQLRCHFQNNSHLIYNYQKIHKKLCVNENLTKINQKGAKMIQYYNDVQKHSIQTQRKFISPFILYKDKTNDASVFQNAYMNINPKLSSPNNMFFVHSQNIYSKIRNSSFDSSNIMKNQQSANSSFYEAKNSRNNRNQEDIKLFNKKQVFISNSQNRQQLNTQNQDSFLKVSPLLFNEQNKNRRVSSHSSTNQKIKL